VVTTERTRGQIIRLSHADGQVIVEPEDEDRFVLTAQTAVKACQDSIRREEAIRTFKGKFLHPLIEWCARHSDRVRACYIPVPVGHIQVFVIGTSPKYDFDLGRELGRLELDLFDTGWRVNVLQLPTAAAEDLQTYFNTEGAIEVYAQLAATPGQGNP
jgi:hypothetical protein